MGIAPEDLERVFEPFERGRAANVLSVPGTGLGLTITKLLTQIMGGEINARSTPGVGTTFTVRVMLSDASRSTHEVITPRLARNYEGSRKKILLIDDDPSHIDIAQQLLQGVSFDVVVANNGRAGIDAAITELPDLAMIDISMPDISGWEVVRQLRADERCKRLKIIMVSANAHEYKAGGGEDEFHDAFVMKPVDVQLLLERMGELLALKWIYESPLADVTPLHPVGVLPSNSRHHIDDLYQLGRIGHVRGIQAKLQEIESEDPSNKPFAMHMRGLVANFDLKRYMNVLEAMRKNA